ncbi:aldehyde dehydrogenase [Candidatus Aquiluna sp. UB-MaderosW2red]|uniref:aldehyde dehydrogenase n=1 Tax=Candidatus Aquiluna sp. UB-MaderosW2red TaxID=1855377 RepID=UPI000875B123|nr:aldehyde dehydrogenase [Candidatus Aquiluna sp. UB-MaderosW2red]SCX04707.1 gamma-glutamyl-gamma-aminobutyraldehyde dehydrogenase/4-guanidinobutyraldehyde dehydrogenase / NAD-dependent aldehyde dehydrogenase [Candidatus Aquiluna sp. UB-MaderosW2red]
MNKFTKEQWLQKAKDLKPKADLFINGEFVPAASNERFETLSPRDGSVITTVARGAEIDIDNAVRIAHQRFEEGVWSRIDPRERQKALYRLSELMLENAAELALLEAIETGHPIGDALNVDVPSAARTYRWYAEAIDKVYDQIAPAPVSALALISREPLGVIGAVVPWNYPLIISAWKLAPALAAGNSVVLKPSEDTNLSSLRLAELAIEAGIPAGVLNVVTGYGAEAGQALGRHPLVDKITFTGSPGVGKMFQKYAGESNGKQVALELGGKSPHIVFEDVEDIEACASAIAWGIFYNAGQTCHGGSRLLVHEAIKDRLLEAVIRVGAALVTGDPMDPKTQVSAIVNKKQHTRVLEYLEIAKQENANVIFGGNAHQPVAGGYFIEPTILDNVKINSRIAQEEIFGPVLAVTTFKTAKEAVELANGTEYGLAASVWTQDITLAHKVAKAVRAGTVWVNTYDVSDIIVPFGGFKNSGFGRDRSLHALDSYTALKTTWINLGNEPI